MREIFVAHEHEISDGGRRIVIDDDVEIGVFRVDGAFYAWRNDCPHQGGPVCQGKLMQGTEERLDADRRSLGIHYRAGSLNIVCPWHGFEFDVRTGRQAMQSIRLMVRSVAQRRVSNHEAADAFQLAPRGPSCETRGRRPRSSG